MDKLKIWKKLNEYVSYYWNGSVIRPTSIKDIWKFKCNQGHIFDRHLNDIRDHNFCNTCNRVSGISDTSELINSTTNLIYSIGSVLDPICNTIKYFNS